MDTGNPPVPAEDEPGQDTGTPSPLEGQTRLHDGHGRFERSPQTVERDARAAELRGDGWTFEKIADELGYADKSKARQGVQRALKDIVRGPAEKLIALEASRLDTMFESALEVLERDHVTVSHGKVIKDDDGNVLLDDGPRLAAIDRMLRVRESYRKLLGLDAPSRVSVDAQQLGDEIAALLDRATSSDDSTGG